MLTARLEVPTDLPFDYVLRAPSSPRELILLLHGYSQSGKYIFSKLESVLPGDAAVLAPNAPFAFAEKKDEQYRMAHSWYFYNFQTDEYVIDMKPALGFLAGGIKKLGFAELPLRVIGFSQGGYLAPFVAAQSPRALQTVLLHSTYLDDELPAQLSFRTDCIVGADDTVVDPTNSERAHAQVLRRSRGGQFFRCEGVGHRIDESVLARVREVLGVSS